MGYPVYSTPGPEVSLYILLCDGDDQLRNQIN